MQEDFTFQCNICYLQFSDLIVPMIVCKNSHLTCRDCIHKIRRYEQNYYSCPFCKEKREINFAFQFKKIFAIKRYAKPFQDKIKDLEQNLSLTKHKLLQCQDLIELRRCENESLQQSHQHKTQQYTNQIDYLCNQNNELSQRIEKQKKRSELLFHKNLELQNMNEKLKHQIQTICKKYQDRYFQKQKVDDQLELEYKRKIEKQKGKNAQLLKENQQLYDQIRKLKLKAKSSHKKLLKPQNELVELESINKQIIENAQQVPGSSKNIKEKKMKIKKAKQVKIQKEQVFRNTENRFKQDYDKNDYI